MRDRPSSTAENIALVRALLTRWELLDDPFALRFLHPARRAIYALFARRGPSGIGKSAFAYLLARTRFFDDLVRRGIEDGIRQVVIVGAGYDARAWRLAQPGVRFVEIDHPATQARKRALAPEGGPEFVAADLAVEPIAGVLRRAKVLEDERAVLVCEGLTMYLAESDVCGLLGGIARASCRGSVLGVNFGTGVDRSPLILRAVMALNRALRAARGERLRFSLPSGQSAEFLESLGWSDVEVLAGQALHERLASDARLDVPLSRLAGAYVASAATP